MNVYMDADMELAEVQRIMEMLGLGGTPMQMMQVQTQQEPLETDSGDENDDSVKALAFEMDFEIQPDSQLLRLPGEMRNKIYGYLDPHGTKTRTVYTSEYRTLSQTSRQLRKEVMSYAINDQSTFYIDYTDLGNFCHALKGMKKDDGNDFVVGVYGRDHWLGKIIDVQSILMHLELRRKGGVRYFAIKDLCCMDYLDRQVISGTPVRSRPWGVIGFLVDTLHVGIVRRDGLSEEDAWCYVDRGRR